jgi:hypothetical protein
MNKDENFMSIFLMSCVTMGQLSGWPELTLEVASNETTRKLERRFILTFFFISQ